MSFCCDFTWKSRHVKFNLPVCSFHQVGMWTFSGFCYLCCSFQSGLVEILRRNNPSACPKALCRHTDSKRRQPVPSQIYSCFLSHLIFSKRLLIYTMRQWKSGSLTIGKFFYALACSWQQIRQYTQTGWFENSVKELLINSVGLWTLNQGLRRAVKQ